MAFVARLERPSESRAHARAKIRDSRGNGTTCFLTMFLEALLSKTLHFCFTVLISLWLLYLYRWASLRRHVACCHCRLWLVQLTARNYRTMSPRQRGACIDDMSIGVLYRQCEVCSAQATLGVIWRYTPHRKQCATLRTEWLVDITHVIKQIMLLNSGTSWAEYWLPRCASHQPLEPEITS